MELSNVTWGDAVVFDGCVDCCVAFACPDGDAVTGGSVTLTTSNTETLALLSGDGDGLTFSASSSSCSISLSVSAAMLSAKLWFSVVFLSSEMLASVVSTAEVLFSVNRGIKHFRVSNHLLFQALLICDLQMDPGNTLKITYFQKSSKLKPDCQGILVVCYNLLKITHF